MKLMLNQLSTKLELKLKLKLSLAKMTPPTTLHELKNVIHTFIIFLITHLENCCETSCAFI